MRIVPSGYISHRMMFDRIGRSLYPSDWNGEIEHNARDGLLSIEQHKKDQVTPGSGMSGGGSGAAVFAPDKRYDHAAILSGAYQFERQARERYDAAHAEFHRRLEAGLIVAYTLNEDTGSIKVIARETWRTKRAANFITSGRGPIGPIAGADGYLLFCEDRKGDLVSPARGRGRIATKAPELEKKMRAMDWKEVDLSTGKELAHRLDAARSTIEPIRKRLRAEKAGK